MRESLYARARGSGPPAKALPALLSTGGVAEPGGETDRAKREALNRLDRLTARELEVLILTARGLCEKGIAKRLGTARSTVSIQRKTMRDRLGVETTHQAIVMACIGGLVTHWEDA